MLKVAALFCLLAAMAVMADREKDPVVLKGSELPELIGQDPMLVVGFRFLEEMASWEQVPVQIDEMHMQDWLTIKQGDCRLIGRDEEELVYADAGTYSGPDEDATFDADDELVFMARQLGDVKPNGFMNPEGTQPGFELELEIQDPLLAFQTSGFIYLFLSDGSINPDAGSPLVQYELNLVNTGPGGTNDYMDAYQLECTDGTQDYECMSQWPVNPEDTWFTSPYYERHFAENWYSNELRIKAGGASGENFINTEDFQFLLGDCSRCQESFVRGRTAFIINKSGPVRAIRSFLGANSGIITQREHLMYEQREDQVTYLRVHTIPGIFQFMNYKAGTPLTYYNCHNLEGLVIDGVDDGEDAFDKTFCHWEMTTGATGSFLRTIEVDYDFGQGDQNDPTLQFQHWYYDNETPTCDSCGSQGAAVHPNDWHMCSSVMNEIPEAWGTHGVKSKPTLLIIPNTDPTRSRWHGILPDEACSIETIEPYLYNFKVIFHQYFLSPEQDPAEGEEYYSHSVTELVRKVL